MPQLLTERALTFQEWLQNELEPRCEFENGMLLPVASSSRKPQRIVGRLYGQFDRWTVENQKGSVEMELDVALPIGKGVIPDLSFIRREREAELFTPDGK